jgi:hypothetical protein
MLVALFATTDARADSVVGSGTHRDSFGWTYVYSVSAESGPLGANATGAFSETSFDATGTQREHFEGAVTCLFARANQATVVGNVTASSPAVHSGQDLSLSVVDNSASGIPDQVGLEFPWDYELATACSSFQTFIPLDTGHIAVQSTPDNVPPVVTVAGTLSVDATGPSGAWVSFTPSATDDLDGSRPVTCNHDWANTYPIGDTSVTCWAYDLSGNRGSLTFTVHVRGASEQINRLKSYTDGLGLPSGNQNTLDADLATALAGIGATHGKASCDSLSKFVKDVQGAAGNKLTSAQIAELTNDADRIEAVLSC